MCLFVTVVVVVVAVVVDFSLISSSFEDVFFKNFFSSRSGRKKVSNNSIQSNWIELSLICVALC